MFKKLIPAILWSFLILYFSTKGTINLPESWWDFFSMDKIGHFGIYGIFTFLLLLGFLSPSSKWKQKGVQMALGISIFYGISMEVIQYAFFPGRYFEYLDIIANIIGSFTGLLFFNFLIKKYD
ncbi:MAG: VanZ family protein [Saprospiraceae bacterium]